MAPWRHASALSLSLAVAVGHGCAGTGTARPAGSVATEVDPSLAPSSRWEDPGWFAALVRTRMGHMERRVREDLAEGAVAPPAIDAVLSWRARVDQALDGFIARGRVTGAERAWTRACVSAMARAAGQYATPVPYGGGPQAVAEPDAPPSAYYLPHGHPTAPRTMSPWAQAYADPRWTWGP